MKFISQLILGMTLFSSPLIASDVSVVCKDKLRSHIYVRYLASSKGIHFIIDARTLKDHDYGQSINNTAKKLGLTDRYDLKHVELTFPVDLCSFAQNNSSPEVLCSLSSRPEPRAAHLNLVANSGMVFSTTIYRLNFGAKADISITKDVRNHANGTEIVGQGLALDIGAFFGRGSNRSKVPLSANANEIASLDCEIE